MTSTLLHGLWHSARAGLLLAFTTLSAAAVTDFEKHADGLAIYMGVVPAQLLRGNADASHLATMHGGLPAASGSHHLVIAIYDERTQRQVEGADVAARFFPACRAPSACPALVALAVLSGLFTDARFHASRPRWSSSRR